MKRSGRLVLLGILGRTPFAGVSWQVLQYLEGLRRLGYDLCYIEDTGCWPFHPGLTAEEQNGPDAPANQYEINTDYAVNYVARLMAAYGFGDRWHYRSRTDERTFGLSAAQASAAVKSADILLNLTGSTRLTEIAEEYRRVPVRIYLETDPVIRQIQVASGNARAIELLNEHTHHFSYGENLGAADCGVPATGFQFRPTRPPIIMDWWTDDLRSEIPQGGDDSSNYTTIANWAQAGSDLEWNGQRYFWSKHLEFMKFIDLPKRVSPPLELALFCKTPEDIRAVPMLESHGWRVRDALLVSKRIAPYRDYILGSRAEFTVAKDQNIRLRSGWFSDRSACYLAAGKPVVTQDTAFDKFLPAGRGLFSFNSMEEVLGAVAAIEADYAGESRAARELASEYLAAEKVLGRLMQAV